MKELEIKIHVYRIIVRATILLERSEETVRKAARTQKSKGEPRQHEEDEGVGGEGALERE